MKNRIEPWVEPIRVFGAQRPHHQPELTHQAEGTKVVYDGSVLRAKGDYSRDLARALIASTRHATAEGVTI
jgi:hypothetical protein